MSTSDPHAPPAGEDRRTHHRRGASPRERGLMVSLTDLWQAAGSPGHRTPATWLTLSDTAAFRAFLRSRWPVATSAFLRAGIPGTWTIDPDGLVATSPGDRPCRHRDDGAAWAHWQLALSYARWLSPSFEAWGNSAVRSALRYPAPLSRRDKALAHHLAHEFRRLHARLDTVDRHAADLILYAASAQELFGPRREFSERSQAIMRAVVAAEPYEGLCPCCLERPVLGPDGKPLPGAEFDHACHRALNRPEHGWLICRARHGEITRGGHLLRVDKLHAFRLFQARVQEQRRRQAAASSEAGQPGGPETD